MLTADLVRVRVRKDQVRPRFIDAEDPVRLAAAEALIEVFEDHLGERKKLLDEAIDDHIGDAPDFWFDRGLVKLLMDKSTVAVTSPKPPTEIREAVFRHAMARWPVGPTPTAAEGNEGATGHEGTGRPAGMNAREDAIAAAAAELELSIEAVEMLLYADLDSEQRLTTIDLPGPRVLLDRYNMSLAQGVLIRAQSVRVTLPNADAKRARQFLRAIKFRQLMHRAKRVGKGWEITLDGPLSLFRQTRRYGLQLALLLPTLCLAERWSLVAEIVWGEDKRGCVLKLDQKTKLVSHAKDTGTWKSDEERHFEASWKKRKSKWALKRSARLIDLDGRGVLVPDYHLKHPDGRTALLDIVWFWRKQSFKRRLDLLADAGPPNLMIAIATRLNADQKSAAGDFDATRVVPFKGVIQPAAIEALAERIGC